MIRSGAVVLAASFAFSACAGHGMIPSGTGAAGDSSNVMRPEATSPCLAANLPYKFGGAFTLSKLSSKASKSTIPKYKGFTVTTTFTSGQVSGSGTVLFCDATGDKDITGKYKGRSFPLYKGTEGTGALYVEAVNTGKSAIGFPKTTPQIQIAGLKNGDTCDFVYVNAKFKWTSTPLEAKVSGGKATFPSVPNEVGFAFPAGTPVFLAAACK